LCARLRLKHFPDVAKMYRKTVRQNGQEVNGETEKIYFIFLSLVATLWMSTTKQTSSVSTVTSSLVFRPPGTISSGRAYILPQMFFFVSPLAKQMLRAPSTDRPETLPHGWNLTEFYKLTSKIRGAVPSKNWGPKTCKISVNLGPLQTLIANISGTAQDIHKRKTL